MKTIENIKKVALAFFIITGLIHLGTSILIANDLFMKYSSIANKVMDIPFIITGMIYGLSSLRISLTNPEKSHKTMDISFIIITLIVLIGLLAINIVIPTLNT
jgi:succinate dehydrogenase hydrophobic anchor subunit